METYHHRQYQSAREESNFASPLSREIICLVWFLLWGLLLVSMLSWNSQDPSFSHVSNLTEENIENIAGRFGAYLSDLIFVLFGVGSWVLLGLVALVLFRTSMRIWRRIPIHQGFFYWLVHLLAWVAVTLSHQGLIEWLSQARWLSLDAPMWISSGPAGVIGILSYSWVQPLGKPLAFVVLWLFLLWGITTVLNFSWWKVLVVLGKWVEYGFLWVSEQIKTFWLKRKQKQQYSAYNNTSISSNASLSSARYIDPSLATHEVSDVNDHIPTFNGLQEHGTPWNTPSNIQNSDEFDTDIPPLRPEDLTDLPSADELPVSPSLLGRQIETPLKSSHTTQLQSEATFSSHIPSHTEVETTLPKEIIDIPFARQEQAPLNLDEGKLLAPTHAIHFTADSANLLPPLSLLDQPQTKHEKPSQESLDFTARLIEKKLSDFGVSVKVVNSIPGPVITRFEIEPAVGVKGSQIVNLGRDLARSLSIVSVRVLETIPGKNYMGLELPNAKRQVVRLSEILSVPDYLHHPSRLAMGLGQDIGGLPVVVDLAKMPHLLVAGTTGSGKSVGVNAMLLSLLFRSTPQEVRLILIDPKMLELSIYEGIPHLLTPVVTDMKEAHLSLAWSVGEMERRYRLMSKLGVRNLAGYNQKIQEAIEKGTPIKNPLIDPNTVPEVETLKALPLIVIVIDELADLMMVVGKKVEELIARLAQKARAAGIHLILATQRPSVDVITGLIKANVPTRLSFQVSSKIDSRTILDQMGAESLLGQGDMLFLPPGVGMPLRAHGAFVADDEVHRVVSFLKETGQPEYISSILETETDELTGFGGQGDSDGESDELYDKAVAIVLENRRASISLVQRHLRIGYNRAARLLEQMEKAGLVSAMRSNGNRDILISNQEH